MSFIVSSVENLIIACSEIEHIEIHYSIDSGIDREV
jgi:hypothetical protein